MRPAGAARAGPRPIEYLGCVAELTRTRQGEMLQKVFEILVEHTDGLQAKSVIAEVEQRLVLTPFEDAEYPNSPGVRRFPKLLRFTSINAVKAGWLVKDAGIWSLSEAGQTAYRQYSDPELLMEEATRLYRQWKRDRPDEEGQDDAGEAPDAPTASATLEEAVESAASEIRLYLGQIDPYDFQDLVAALLRAMGYHVVWVAPRGPDGGLDLVAQADPLGTTGPRIKGQVKRRNDKTGADELRSFIALLGTHDVGVFISLAGFSPDAQSLARNQEIRRVTLLAFSDLLELWIENYPKLDEVARRLLPLKPVHFLAPQD